MDDARHNEEDLLLLIDGLLTALSYIACSNKGCIGSTAESEFKAVHANCSDLEAHVKALRKRLNL